MQGMQQLLESTLSVKLHYEAVIKEMLKDEQCRGKVMNIVKKNRK